MPTCPFLYPRLTLTFYIFAILVVMTVNFAMFTSVIIIFLFLFISDGQSNHLNLFNNRPQPKKKRKSRTAFTNHQIFELEKRFLYQKYLSPADRDEIAASLGLSNAQVITWFQNRRAKLKRDMEELKKDVESAKILTAHKSFLENVTDLGILKKKPMVNLGPDDCPKNLVMSHDK